MFDLGFNLRYAHEFNLEVFDPSDRKGTDTYCVVAIEDKKMGLYHIA